MRARGLASPDLGDCLALSFAVTVQPKRKAVMDPYAEELMQRIRNGEPLNWI